MEFKDKIAVVTGGCHGIGLACVRAFEREGARVAVIDTNPAAEFVGDVGEREDLEAFAAHIREKYGRVDCLVNNAPPLMRGIESCSYEAFERALRVGVTAPFYLTKLLMPLFGEGAAVLNISSSRDRQSMPGTESYTAAKGGISALTHAMAASLGPRVRVNSVSPGWIDTEYRVYEGPDAVQQPVGRVGNPDDIAEAVLFLCSPRAGFITGENLTVDGGMTRLMIYHDEHGWTYRPEQ
ncbi:MAG: SDR family oxidoreductase [Clostridia bacterium]|nr:SDR family oxidoreductase [Clostridia bacterium]